MCVEEKTENQQNLVFICRSPGDYSGGLYDYTKIKNVHWGCISGGLGKRQSGFSLYGYIPYSDAVDLVACSGRHDFQYNDAKICICASHNKDPEHRQAYAELVRLAGPKPKPAQPRTISRPPNAPPCTKRIRQLLDDREEIDRLELYSLLTSENYMRKTIDSALKSLARNGIINPDAGCSSMYCSTIRKIK